MDARRPVDHPLRDGADFRLESERGEAEVIDSRAKREPFYVAIALYSFVTRKL
jgi:hypothetical protein